MNTASIYHRTVDNYCYASDADRLTIKICTGYDVANISLCYGDPFEKGIMGGKERFCFVETPIIEKKYLKNSIAWFITIVPEYKRLAYFFLLEGTDGAKLYFLENRFYTPEEFQSYTSRLQHFTYPWMNPADLFVTPDWVNNTVWYQIFIDRFCNGNQSLDPDDVLSWSGPDKSVTYKDFYGGDIPGITSKLDYLKELGITGIYLTPICLGRSNHKYDTLDFETIDPHFGSDEDMKHLVSEAHARGIRIMMDGVFNHMGHHCAMWEEIKQIGPKSKYYNWFMINQWPFDPPTYEFTNNSRAKNFYSFAFFDSLPKLNTNNPEVIDYLTNVCLGWIRKYDIDGLRLDVANEVSHAFCKKLRQALKAEKPDFYILGEIWHDATPWLRGDEFDSVMNYPIQEGIDDFWSIDTSTSKDFEYAINRCYTLYPSQVNRVLFNLLDSHDTIRLITKLGSKDRFYQQMAFLFTLPGTLCIYYGTEVLLEGAHDPDCRRCMPWTEIERGDYDDRIAAMKKLISLRTSEIAARNDSFEFHTIDEHPRILWMTKHCFDCQLHVIANCEDETFTKKVDNSEILFDNQINKGNDYINILPNGIVIYKTSSSHE